VIKEIEERDFLPEHLQKSAVVVEVKYGNHNHSQSHTAYIGEITFNLVPQMGYLWFLIGGCPTFADLRGALRAWPLLRHFFSSELFAWTTSERNAAFLSHFGFTPYLIEGDMRYFKEVKNGL
jgi:hypothetical protein